MRPFVVARLLGHVGTTNPAFSKDDIHLDKERFAEFEILIGESTNLNFLDAGDGQSILHKRAKIGCLKSVLFLLSRNASVNLVSTSGDYPIHLAAESAHADSLQVIKAMVLFGADVNTINHEGKSARHIVAENPKHAENGSKLFLTTERWLWLSPHFTGHKLLIFRKLFYSCPENSEFLCSHNCDGSKRTENELKLNYKEGREFSKTGNYFPSTNPKSLCVLSLDGGGIRGLVLTQMLLFLEQYTGIETSDIFQFYAGTSTGGILALGLTTGRSVLECQGLYFQLKDQVFTGGKPYEVSKLETLYKNVFGHDKRLGDIRASNAAKLTGAAPYYFRMEHADLVDGGLLANNPSLDALSELSKIRKSSLHTEIWGKNPKMFVSLGTGFKADVDYTAAYLNLSSKSIASSTKSLSTLTNTIKFFMELTTGVQWALNFES
ncbi:Phospholipase A I [Folsomia candida]|uniref:phospholipase A2 n=1 Tax=Folsomia candida TaxID=158441 RepID=A0A226D8R0_FOLCA|nr:Phospholipase A I [Folsomia candida]